jgi:hypothetical protein
LLIDALNSTIPMNLKFRDEIDFAIFDNLMEKYANVILNYHVWHPTLKNKLLEFWIILFPS